MHVTGVDVNKQVVDIINKGSIHLIEPDLKGLVYSLAKNEFLGASSKPSDADVFLVAVPTPFEDGHIPELAYVEATIKMVIPHLKKGNLMIIESTSPVGTTGKFYYIKFYYIIKKSRPDLAGNF